jgi:hypothetical protein
VLQRALGVFGASDQLLLVMGYVVAAAVGLRIVARAGTSDECSHVTGGGRSPSAA